MTSPRHVFTRPLAARPLSALVGMNQHLPPGKEMAAAIPMPVVAAMVPDRNQAEEGPSRTMAGKGKPLVVVRLPGAGLKAPMHLRAAPIRIAGMCCQTSPRAGSLARPEAHRP